MIYSEIKLPRRKWLAIPKTEMIEEEDVADKKAKGKAPVKSGKDMKVEETIKEEKKLIPKFVRKMVEMDSYQGYFEETLLTLHEDFHNFVDYFIEHWSDHLNTFVDKIGNDEVIENYKTNLNKTIEFYSLFFDINSMFAKIQATFKDSPAYIEYICKFIKRTMELELEPKQIEGYANGVDINRQDALLESTLSLIALKEDAFKNDIDWNPSGLKSLIDENKVNKSGNEQAIEIFTTY